jgi:hypothetical protein
MVTLAMIGVSFAYRAGIESRLARGREVRARLEQHAASAVAIAVARIVAHKKECPFDHPAQSWRSHEPLSTEGWDVEWSANADGGPGEIDVDYQVVDEASKLNLLIASGQAMKKLGMTEAQVAALFDWMDQDDVEQAEGAEQAAYLAHQPAYQCKNAPVEVMDELLRIQGFSRWDYYGADVNHNGLPDAGENNGEPWAGSTDGSPRPGWVNLCTCVGDGRINLNTACRLVLETLPISDEAVGQIIGFRQFDDQSSGELPDHCFRSSQDIDQLQGLSDADRAVLKTLGRFDSSDFRIFATARHVPTGLCCRIEALVRMADQRLEVMQWKVNP